MASPLLDRLQQKVQQASTELLSLKKDRERLQAEVDLMKEENRRARRLSREHQEITIERDKIKTKLQHILQNLEKLKI